MAARLLQVVVFPYRGCSFTAVTQTKRIRRESAHCRPRSGVSVVCQTYRFTWPVSVPLPRECLRMCCRRLKGGGGCFCPTPFRSHIAFSGGKDFLLGLSCFNLLVKTHPQRHSILEVLRRSESVRWFLSRCGPSCSPRKQWLDLFQNRQQPTINSSIFHQWTHR